MPLDREKVRNPAPGQYNLPQGDSTKWSMRGRPNDPANRNPGPGAYETQRYKETGGDGYTRKYTMQGRAEDSPNRNPGPGDYELARYKEIGSDAQKFVYGKAERMPYIKNSPGPGDYEVKTDPKGPKWAIRGRSSRSNSRERDTSLSYDIPAAFPIMPKYNS
jgi:hypothetical protein